MDDHSLARAAASLAEQGITADELTRLLRQSRGAPAPIPVPAPPVISHADERPEADGALVRAQAALDARSQHETLTEGSKAILQQRGLDLAWDEYQPEELHFLAGLRPDKPGESPADKHYRERDQRERMILADPKLLAEELHRRDVEQFRSTFWQASKEVRVSEADRLGIDLSTYQPPESFNGLS